ncbi:branched-chain amino acid transport system II carrier protein, partial [Staphylococcus epidermidis]|uniref:branched-chain amino acid transport system II carrier protein n=1 Tax=Staphylococcus epidermidis TaxID=1282 RepID=UPI001642CC1E
ATFPKYLLAIILSLASLTTPSPLILSLTQYFHTILPNIPYKLFLIFFILLTFILPNQPLNSLIKISLPLLTLIYPLPITLIFLILIPPFIPTKPIPQQIPLIILPIQSILTLITTQPSIPISFIHHLPLKQYSLQSFPIPLLPTLLPYIITYFLKQSNILYQKQ